MNASQSLQSLDPGCTILGGSGHTCSLSLQGLRPMLCPSGHQPLRPLPESLTRTVLLLSHGRIPPLGRLWALSARSL